MKKLPPKYMAAAVAILVCVVAVSCSSTGDQGQLPSASDPKSSTARTIQALGYIEPLSMLRRLEFNQTGIVAECLVEVGQRVAKDDVLLRLDDRTARKALDVASRQLAVAVAERDAIAAPAHPDQIEATTSRLARLRAQHEQAVRDWDRLQKLENRRAASKQDLEKAELQLTATNLSVKEAEAELRRLKEPARSEDLVAADARVAAATAMEAQRRQELDEHALLAPSDGRVLDVLKHVGEVVSVFRFNPAILFADDTRLRVRAEVDERFIADVAVGQPARIVGTGLGDEAFAGRVSQVKHVMGTKTVFSRTSDERKDLEVIEVFVDLPRNVNVPIGLRVDVIIDTSKTAE